MFDEKKLPEVDKKIQVILKAVASETYANVKNLVDSFLKEYEQPQFKEGEPHRVGGECYLLYPYWKEDWEEMRVVRSTFLHGSKTKTRLLELLFVLVPFALESDFEDFDSVDRPKIRAATRSYLKHREALVEPDGPLRLGEFRFKKKVFTGMPEREWNFVSFLWTRQSVKSFELAEPVFGDHSKDVTPGSVRGLRDRAANWFENNGIKCDIVVSKDGTAKIAR